MSVNPDQAIFDAIAAATSVERLSWALVINVQKFIDTFNNHRDRKLCTSLDVAQAAPNNEAVDVTVGRFISATDAARNEFITAMCGVAQTPERCARCGRETKGEAALVGTEIWCHPCADAQAPFHPDSNLPGCMMPDGGDCCEGYQALLADWRRLNAKRPTQP